MRKILLVMFATIVAWEAIAQGTTVSGKVTSAEDNAPIPGVNVVLKGSTTGTVTDAEGKYSLTVPTGGSLIFSFIGMVSKEMEIGGRTQIDISLESDARQLAEVVVTAIGIE